MGPWWDPCGEVGVAVREQLNYIPKYVGKKKRGNWTWPWEMCELQCLADSSWSLAGILTAFKEDSCYLVCPGYHVCPCEMEADSCTEAINS